MKKAYAVLYFILFLLILNPALAGEIKSVTLEIEGMTCSLCAPAVKKAITRVEGVKAVNVSFEKKEARIQYEEGKASFEEMIKAVEEIGYKAKIGKGAGK